jgi:hypothetical protein
MASIDLGLSFTTTPNYGRQITNYSIYVSEGSHYRYGHNLPGSSNGKSKEANMIATKIHQPDMHVTKVNPPAAFCNFNAMAVLPLVIWKYAPVKHPKAHTRVKKIMTKAMLVRMLHMR